LISVNAKRNVRFGTKRTILIGRRNVSQWTLSRTGPRANVRGRNRIAVLAAVRVLVEIKAYGLSLA
jgi:hypothetical protein